MENRETQKEPEVSLSKSGIAVDDEEAPFSAPTAEVLAPQADAITGVPAPPCKSARMRKRIGAILIMLGMLLLLASSSVAALTGYQAVNARYQQELALAQNGVQHLRHALDALKTLQSNPLNAPAVKEAGGEFSAALSALSQVDDDLRALPGIVSDVPVYGSRVQAALHLLPIAIAGTQAGVAGCALLKLLIERLQNPLSSSGGGLTLADMAIIGQDFEMLKVALTLVIDQAEQLQPSDLQLDPRLGQMMPALVQQLPSIQAWLNDADKLLAVAPALLGIGSPANYLLELVDSTELRPTGGFIGNYGLATIAGGRLLSAHITDVYLFDQAFDATHQHNPYLPQYGWFLLVRHNWYFRDSNLEADFPTSARYSEANYLREGGTGPLQGVISITPTLIQNAMTVTGPIVVPKYHEVVTAQNLVDRIHYYQLGPGRVGEDTPSPDGKSSVRKHFTELLSEQFLARIHQLAPATFAKLLQVLLSGLRTKDLQVYFNAAPAENALTQLHMNGAILSPPGDSLFVVDANIAPSKANAYMVYTLHDTVTLDTLGNALHQTTLTYHWALQGPVYGVDLYRDYVRVYLPPASQVLTQSGWVPYGTSVAYQRQVVAGMIYLRYGQTLTLQLTWFAPHAATRDGAAWHYQYELQRQAGNQWQVDIQVHPPSCAIISKTAGGFTAQNKKFVTLAQTLAVDTQASLQYACG